MVRSVVRSGSGAEVAGYPGLAAVRTSDVVSLDRKRRLSEPAHAPSAVAGPKRAFFLGERLLS